MSEIKKNIETCRGEDVLAEVSALPQDTHFGSLVNEALDPLKQQAAAQAGYDGYSEVIDQHKPYTFASFIAQMKSNLLLLLRALWQYPFGSGTLRSLSDMWQHYITRLSGNDTYGIPSRLSSLTDLPSAPLLVADRKISGADVPDGMSLVHLLCGAYGDITELTDDNVGWTWTRMFPTFANLTKLQMGCAYILDMTTVLPTTLTEIRLPELLSYGLTYSGDTRPMFIYNNPNLTELTFDKLQMASTGFTYDVATEGCFISTCANLKKIYFPELVAWGKNLPGHGNRTNDAYCCLIHSCAELEEVYMPKWTGVCNWRIIRNCPKVWKVVLGNITSGVPSLYSSTAYPFSSCVKLRHLEFAGVQVSLDLRSWNPDAETLAHQDFLPNFRTYIALRLATFASNGPTLTLSQAVYDAIKDESHLFVFDEGTMTIYAYLTNIKHWTVTK